MNVTTELAGERVELRSDRALYWPRRRTLIVADLHFGKAATFRAASVPVPGDSRGTLARLSNALTATGASRLVVLGDFWHARAGRSPEVLDELSDWRQTWPSLEIVLVKGNHDRAGPPPEGWATEWCGEARPEAPFVYAHLPMASDDGHVLCGHLHPGYRVRIGSQQLPTLPCYWSRDTHTVLPAFGSFTGFAAVTPHPNDRVYLIADDDVIHCPPPTSYARD